jgi:hypothetical protein
VIGAVEPRTFEDDGGRAEHASHRSVTGWTIRNGSIGHMLGYFETSATGSTLEGVEGHGFSNDMAFGLGANDEGS